jgi:hypothetical protein
MRARTRTLLAWSLWLATLGCLLGGLVVTLVLTRPLPLAARLAALIGDSVWAIGVALAITLPLLLLPGGRLRSRRWRVVVVACVAGTAMNMVGWWLSPGPMTQTLEPVAKPFALTGGAAPPAVGPGPTGQPDGHLRAGHRPPAGPLPAGRPGRLRAVRGVGQPGRGRRHPGRCAGGSRSWSTGASTAAATTPPGRWRGSRPGGATRSTWTP